MKHELVNNNTQVCAGALFYTLLISLLAFSPFLGLCFSLLYLYTSYERLQEINKNLLLLYIVTTTSIVIGSKQYGIELDFVNYYSDYRSVLDNPESLDEVLNNYGSGLEFIMPLSYWALSKLNLELSPAVVMMFMTIIILIPFIYWVKTNEEISEIKNSKILIICSLLCISTILYNQLFRQALASIFIIFSLGANPLKRMFYLLFGSIIHLTTIPIYMMLMLVLKKKYKTLITLALISFIIIYSNFFNYYIIKFSSYSLSYNLNNIVLDNIKWIIIYFIIYISIAIKIKGIPKGKHSETFILICIIYIILMPFGHLVDRILLIPLLMISGVFIGNMLINVRDKRFSFAIIASILIIKLLNFSGIFGEYFWMGYPIYSTRPFYYII